jgi:hypothetical protein
MSDNNDVTEQEYQAEVSSTAENIVDAIEEYPEDYADDPWMCIHESIYSHQWIIYTSYHLDVLRHSESGPEEWSVYVEDGENDHRKVLEAMAYTTFRADVSHEVFDLAEERGIEL